MGHSFESFDYDEVTDPVKKDPESSDAGSAVDEVTPSMKSNETTPTDPKGEKNLLAYTKDTTPKDIRNSMRQDTDEDEEITPVSNNTDEIDDTKQSETEGGYDDVDEKTPYTEELRPIPQLRALPKEDREEEKQQAEGELEQGLEEAYE